MAPAIRVVKTVKEKSIIWVSEILGGLINIYC
jgi:hypothetical protein